MRSSLEQIITYGVLFPLSWDVNIFLLKRSARYLSSDSLMQRPWLLGVVFFSVIALVWAVTVHAQNVAREADLFRLLPGATPSPELIEYAKSRAKPLIASHCASCHGAILAGDPTRGIPDLTDAEWLYGTGTITEIEQTILYGVRSGHHRAHDAADMPAFGNKRPYRRYTLPTFTSGQIGDLADFVQAFGGRPVNAAARARGQALFYGSGQCYDCHTSDASGDTYIGAPNLVDKVWLYGGSRAAIVRSITDGRAGICPAWAGRLSAVDIRMIAVAIAAGRRPAPNHS